MLILLVAIVVSLVRILDGVVIVGRLIAPYLLEVGQSFRPQSQVSLVYVMACLLNPVSFVCLRVLVHLVVDKG